MKKLIMALLVIGLFPVLAWAQPPPFPPGEEVDSWAWICDDAAGCRWVSQGSATTPMPRALARLFYSGGADSTCNKNWIIPFKTHASIAQWLRWDFNGLRWDWLVRKPGTYCGNCLSFEIWSNQRVLVNFHDFGPLEYQGSNECPNLTYQPDPIDIWYIFNPDGAQCPDPESPDWMTPDELNDPDIGWWEIEDSYSFHMNGEQYKFWNMIRVLPCHSACEYQDHGTITLDLMCQKPWIDDEYNSGFFWDYVPPTP